jgi:hypothetical protein
MSSVHHIWWPMKGHLFIWGQSRLHQTGGDCLGSGPDCPALQWSLSSRRVPPTPPPHTPQLSYGGSLRSPFYLLVLLGTLFPLGTWGKSSEPTTAVKAGNRRNQGPARGLYQTADATWAKLNFSALRLFLLW